MQACRNFSGVPAENNSALLPTALYVSDAAQLSYPKKYLQKKKECQKPTIKTGSSAIS